MLNGQIQSVLDGKSEGCIVQGDCQPILADMPEKRVDLVLTDPPYGIGAYANGTMGAGVLAKQSTYKATTWDTKPMTPGQSGECMRVGKEQMFFGGNYFVLPPSSCWIVWDKNNGNNNFADCELVWTSYKTAIRLVKWKWQGMLQEA